MGIEAEPFQPGERQQRAVEFAALDFFQPCLDIAAQQRGVYVGAKPLHLRRAAQRSGADSRAFGKLQQSRAITSDKGVAHVLARQIAGDDDFRRQMRRQILGRMHREVDGPSDQCRVQLFGEQPLAAGLRQSAILNRIARGADDFNCEMILRDSVGFSEQRACLVCLRQRQRAAARADAKGRGGHGAFRFQSRPSRDYRINSANGKHYAVRVLRCSAAMKEKT